MAQSRAKQTVITAAIVLVILFAVIAAMLFIRSQTSSQGSTDVETINVETEQTVEVEDEDTSATTPIPDEEEPVAKPDAANFTTIAIDPLAINIYYTKGTGPFEFAVLRTPGGTRFVEFRAPSLIGTKCTDDLGAFASIIEDPKESDSTTLAESIQVGANSYGLSLATDACTSDAGLLSKYQSAFRDGLPLLSAIE